MTICTKCGIDKPEERFGIRKDTGKRRGHCKDCTNTRLRAWAHKNPDKRAETSHKNYAKKVGKDPEACRGQIGSAEWEKRKKPNKEPYYHRNRLTLLAKGKERQKNKKTEISAYQKDYRSKNMEQKKENDRLWRLNNPDLVALYSNSRRARKLQAQPQWLTAIHKAQMREMYDIAQCRYIQTGIRHHVDHIFPLHGEGFCGLHVPWNLRVLTKRENLSKHRRVPPEFTNMLFEATR
jgi:hypothetical protein